MTIAQSLSEVQATIPSSVQLVAVSKTKPNELIIQAYNCGQRIFGENKVQELVSKYESLPKDIKWHMIGHLQRNKVKYIAPFVDLIHGVDSLKLLSEVNKQGQKNNRIVPVLIQFHIATEESKFGFSLTEAKALLTSLQTTPLPFISIRGVMGMATFTDSEAKIKSEFASLKAIFSELKNDFFTDQKEFDTISMGMSGDYLLAIEQGSTMVRVGSAIFGAR